MARIVLGSEPHKLTVRLAPDSDFLTTIRSKGDDWGVDFSLSLVFSTRKSDDVVVWEAAVSGKDATFTIQESAVNDLIALRPYRVKMMAYDGSDDLLWGLGTVDIYNA